MNKDVEEPCEACGGLLPLKAVQTRVRRGRHRQSCSLHPKQKKPGQVKEKSRGKSEQGSTSESKGTRESRSRQLSSTSDGQQAEVTSSRNRRLNYELREQFQATKPAVLKQFQAAFAHQKAIRCAIHGDQEQTERTYKQEKTLSPGDLGLPCHLHRHEGNSHNESVCTRIVGHLPQEDASNSSSNRSTRHAATQMSCKHLLAISKQSDARGEPPAAINSSQSGRSASTKTCERGHATPEYQHHKECRLSGAISPPEPCHLHHIEEHITASQRSSSRDSRKLQRCDDHQLHTQPQILCTSLVQHHAACHLHRDSDHALPAAAQSPIPRVSTKLCKQCGLPEPARNEFSPHDRKASHHSPKAYVKIESLCAQMVTPRSEVHSPCILHGDCGPERVPTCATCWHPKTDHINAPDDHKKSKKGKIHGCHLHRDVLVSKTPGRVAKPQPRGTSLRWLDRIIASQSIPPQIIREFLQGKRGWPPEAMKQKCLGCIRKQTGDGESPRDPSPCNYLDVASWNPGSSVAQSTTECAKEHVVQNEKLARLLMARTQIIRPVVKLSTSKEVWRSRKELQFCSECWNPAKYGLWRSILDGMPHDADMTNCHKRVLFCTPHGNPNPCDTGDVNLNCPQLFSTFQLRLQAQQLRNEAFDRNIALKVAQKKCIKLDMKALAHVPEKKSPPRVDRSKQESPSLRRRHDAIAQKRQEAYVGLSKIEQPPHRICRVERPPREVGVLTNRPKLMPKPPEIIWRADDFCPDKIHSPRNSRVQAMPKGMPSTASPINRVEQAQVWVEDQHWAQGVEACKQARNMVAVCDRRLHAFR